MRAILMGAAAAILLAGAATADDSALASRFGNTTIATTADGTTVKLYYKADHTFTGKTGSQATNGTWKIDGTTVCLTYANPAMLPAGAANPVCVPVAAHAVGDTWTVGVGMQKRTISLVKGIQ
jgi:hypothetical protein